MEPTPIPASLRTLLTVAAAVLALVGIVGVASGAADDDGDDVTTAGGRTTTTVATSDSTLAGGESTSTTAAVGATGTTLKAPNGAVGSGPTTTVAAVETNACASPPDTGTNPGAIAAPALGVYTYVSCTDPSKSQETTVRAGQDGGGKVRREISANFGGFSGTFVTAYGGGVFEEVLKISAFGQTIVCDFNPDVTAYPANLSVGATWSTKSSCTAQGTKISYEYDGKITGRKTVTLGGTAVNTWVVETTQKFSAPPQGSGSVTSTRYYDPTRGYDLFLTSTADDGDGNKVTESVRLASLTPKPL